MKMEILLFKPKIPWLQEVRVHIWAQISSTSETTDENANGEAAPAADVAANTGKYT